MISVNEAATIIQAHTKSLEPISIPLSSACGLILATDIVSPNSIPAYPQSSMDGYAFIFSDTNNTLNITGEMAAGAAKPFTIKEGEAARIFTGAPLPEGADTVVMQEKVNVNNGKLKINDPQIKKGINVRLTGAEIEKGMLAMPAKSALTVGAIGFLAGIGIKEVLVYPPPSVTIILTGNELQTQDKQLSFGKVYDSNSIMLAAALRLAGVTTINILKAEDEIGSLQRALEKGLTESDLVLLTGGVSVGDYDFVTHATQLCGIQTKFHRVKQKPGKPLFFGVKENKLVFGLPGNPSSALTCFYIYVLPAIKGMLQKPITDNLVKGILLNDYAKIPGLTQFLKATLIDGKVSLLHAQESFRLHSFAQANCLAQLDEANENYNAGEEIIVHLLPV